MADLPITAAVVVVIFIIANVNVVCEGLERGSNLGPSDPNASLIPPDHKAPGRQRERRNKAGIDKGKSIFSRVADLEQIVVGLNNSTDAQKAEIDDLEKTIESLEGKGTTIHVEMIPQVPKELDTKTLQVVCRLTRGDDHSETVTETGVGGAPDTPHGNVVALSISRVGQTLAMMTQKGVQYGRDTSDRDRIQADGKLEKYMRLLISDPTPSDSGPYMCHALINGTRKMEEVTAYGHVTVKKLSARCNRHYTLWREGKKCIRIWDEKDRISYKDATSFCEKIDNGRVVVIDSLAKQNFLTKIPMEHYYYWIGATRVDAFSYPSGGLMKLESFRWHPTELRHNPGNERDCLTVDASLHKASLIETSCGLPCGFFCEEPALGTGNLMYCKSKESFLYRPERTCVTKFDKRLVYEEAGVYCASFNSNGRRLLELKSRIMQEFLTAFRLVSKSNGYWIGAKRPYSFKTLDGTPLPADIRWRTGQPNNFRSKENCLNFMALYGGALKDESCQAVAYIMCETDATVWHS